MTQANLIIGGVQKGGTTTLFEHLRQHAEIAFGDEKELHVASDKDRFSDPGYNIADVYPRRFPGVSATSGSAVPRYLADATPVYCYWPNAVERLAAYNPAIKLVLIYRDPIERAFSHWQMEFARGLDPMSFPQAIRSGRGRVSSDPSAPGFHRVYSYVERGFYAGQLRRVFAHFPRAQVLVLENRMLRDDLDGTLDRIWAFLGLDAPVARPSPIRANSAPRFDYGYTFDRRDGEFLYRLFQWDIEAFGELSGLDVSHWGAAYRNASSIATADVLRERPSNDADLLATAAFANSVQGHGASSGYGRLHEPDASFMQAPQVGGGKGNVTAPDDRAVIEDQIARLRQTRQELQDEIRTLQSKRDAHGANTPSAGSSPLRKLTRRISAGLGRERRD